MTIPRPARVLSVLAALLLLGVPHRAVAQEPPPPAFSLSSSETYTTTERPSFWLTFRHTTAIDFRVYKVRDAHAFFDGLRDPHQLGTDEPMPVPQTRSWLERIADWKATQRTTIHRLLRAQVSPAYRRVRREATDRQVVSQRVTTDVRSFAQVPLLNREQMVVSWREILPDRRDPELRRIPLTVPGPGVYVVEGVHDRSRAYTIVMVSDVGVVAKASPGQLLLFAADRGTGEPRADCAVSVRAGDDERRRGTTSREGLFEAALPDRPDAAPLAVAVCGEHVAVNDPGLWSLEAPSRELVGWVYTDKPIYRPGHTAHIKGVLRWRQRDAVRPFDRSSVEVVVADPNDKVIARATRPVDEFGAVTLSVTVPDTASLGAYTVRLNSEDHQATGSFEVQEYRRPEFEVTVTPAQRFAVQGTEAVVRVQARYYFGQPVANGRVRYSVSQQPYYSPLSWDEGFEGENSSGGWYGNVQDTEGRLQLDAEGRGEIRIPLGVTERPTDYSVRVDARVTDASRREVSDATVVHATYGTMLVAGRLDRYVYKPGEQASVGIRTVAYTGEPQAGQPVTLTLERLTYPEGYYGEPTATAAGSATARTDEAGRATATLPVPKETGSYRIRLSVPAGPRSAEDTVWFWVPGPGESTDTSVDRYIEVIPDRRSYAPGDTARLGIRGETLSGPVLVTKEGQQVSWAKVMRLEAGAPIEVPITAGDVGDIAVHVTWLREGRITYGERRLSVPATSRTLQVRLEADRPTARPQEPGVFTVRVTDAEGRPVRAQLSLGVIDEAVYGVKADDTPDPVRVFHRRDYSRVGTSFSRDYHFVGYSGSDQLQLARRGRRRFTLADFKGDTAVQPQVRKEFPDAIYWVADVVTDDSGTGRIAVRYPDSLTTWRLTARAITRDTRAGTGIVRTTTTKDLIVRTVPPRFLTEGDDLLLPTIVHNYRSEPRTAEVSLAVEGLDTPSGELSPTRGVVEPNGSRQDDWALHAGVPGTAVLTTTARTETDADALELQVPVVPFGVAYAKGVSGTLAAQAREASVDVAMPATAAESTRRVRVSLAPSLGGTVLGALDMLTGYPYGCTEQTLSAFVPTLVASRTLRALELPVTERLSAIDRQVTSGLRRLYDLQHDDGGWGWWKSDGNHPFMTAYALSGMLEAKRSGYAVDEYRLGQATRALATLYLDFPRAIPDLKAYIVRTLGQARGDSDQIDLYTDAAMRAYTHRAALDDLWVARSDLSAHGTALLALALLDAKDARAAEAVTTLVAAAQSRGDLAWWPADRDPLLYETVDTSVEATSLAVQALAAADPKHRLLAPAVRWLVVNRRGTWWASTKQTALAVEGLLSYMRAAGASQANAVEVSVSVNGTEAGRHRFEGTALALAEPISIEAPARAGTNAVRIESSGGSPVHWTATADYVDPTPAGGRQGSRELAITRRYARLTPVKSGNATVFRESAFDGTARPGDLLAVRLTIAGSPDWRYLMIRDPLPAGVEAVQDDSMYPLERPRTDVSQVEYRDQQTVFFREQLDGPQLEVAYVVRVTAAGRFRASPATVEPMYVPDVAASSEPLTLTVTTSTGGAR